MEEGVRQGACARVTRGFCDGELLRSLGLVERPHGGRRRGGVFGALCRNRCNVGVFVHVLQHLGDPRVDERVRLCVVVLLREALLLRALLGLLRGALLNVFTARALDVRCQRDRAISDE